MSLAPHGSIPICGWWKSTTRRGATSSPSRWKGVNRLLQPPRKQALAIGRVTPATSPHALPPERRDLQPRRRGHDAASGRGVVPRPPPRLSTHPGLGAVCPAAAAPVRDAGEGTALGGPD